MSANFENSSKKSIQFESQYSLNTVGISDPVVVGNENKKQELNDKLKTKSKSAIKYQTKISSTFSPEAKLSVKTPVSTKKSKGSEYSSNLKESSKSCKNFTDNSVKLINRSTSINGSDLNYAQINKDTYSKKLMFSSQ